MELSGPYKFACCYCFQSVSEFAPVVVYIYLETALIFTAVYIYTFKLQYANFIIRTQLYIVQVHNNLAFA